MTTKTEKLLKIIAKKYKVMTNIKKFEWDATNYLIWMHTGIVIVAQAIKSSNCEFFVTKRKQNVHLCRKKLLWLSGFFNRTNPILFLYKTIG
jgi:hypothetical protein